MTRNAQKRLNQQRIRRARRVRATLHGTAQRPRISVDRSNMHVYLQAIDDDKRVTIVGVRDEDGQGTKTERAQAAAKKMAAALKKAGITKAVFDRGYYRYHGRVKAVADTLREEGMEV